MIELIPLKCPQCDSSIPANPKEIAWICENCGQGLFLDKEKGLTRINIHFAMSDSNVTVRWLPFWVVRGKVLFTKRVTYTMPESSDPLWRTEQTFMLPAFECKLVQALEWGTILLRNPINLIDGPRTSMEPVSIDTEAVQALAEFIVFSIEAQRMDKLEMLTFDLSLEEPELWVIPFAGKEGLLQLGIAK